MKQQISFWLVLFVAFLDWMGIGLVYPIFSSILFHPDHSILDPSVTVITRGWYLGVLLASMSIAQFFSAPLLGSMSDQKGRKPLFLLSLAVGVFGYIFCIFGIIIGNVFVLIAARCLVGFSAGNSSIVNASIVDLSSDENKARHFGLYNMMCGLGFTIGPFLGGWLSNESFTFPFCVAGFATFMSLALIFFFFKETHKVRKKAKTYWNEGVRNLKRAFKVKGLNTLFLTILMFSFGWSFFYEFIPVSWIGTFNFKASEIGFFYAYGSGVYALSSGVLIGPILGRCDHMKILFYVLSCLSLILFSLIFLPSSFWIWIYLPIVNFLVALVYPTSTTLISNMGSKEAQGEILGVLQSVQSAAFALSPLAAGWLLGKGPFMPMVVGGISMFLAAFILGSFLKKSAFQRG